MIALPGRPIRLPVAARRTVTVARDEARRDLLTARKRIVNALPAASAAGGLPTLASRGTGARVAAPAGTAAAANAARQAAVVVAVRSPRTSPTVGGAQDFRARQSVQPLRVAARYYPRGRGAEGWETRGGPLRRAGPRARLRAHAAVAARRDRALRRDRGDGRAGFASAPGCAARPVRRRRRGQAAGRVVGARAVRGRDRDVARRVGPRPGGRSRTLPRARRVLRLHGRRRGADPARAPVRRGRRRLADPLPAGRGGRRDHVAGRPRPPVAAAARAGPDDAGRRGLARLTADREGAVERRGGPHRGVRRAVADRGCKGCHGLGAVRARSAQRAPGALSPAAEQGQRRLDRLTLPFFLADAELPAVSLAVAFSVNAIDRMRRSALRALRVS